MSMRGLAFLRGGRGYTRAFRSGIARYRYLTCHPGIEMPRLKAREVYRSCLVKFPHNLTDLPWRNTHHRQG